MICMPGVTFVHLRATSVTKLISMPGEISTNSEACPAMGRKPCDTVAKNDATCGCRLSKKMYERKSAMILIIVAGAGLITNHAPTWFQCTCRETSRPAQQCKPRFRANERWHEVIG